MWLVGLSGHPASRPALAETQESDQQITAYLSSGRSFTAEVDRRTDSTHLWLRWQRESAVVLRSIRWDRVIKVRAAGEELSGEQFRGVVEVVRQDVPAQAEAAAVPERIIITASADPAQPVAAASTGPNQLWPGQAGQASRVRSVAIDAVVANWDADVEVDGLIVHVYPLDANGAMVPARGTLDVNLIGQRHGIVKRSRPFTSMGRWTRQLRKEDFSSDGAVYRLPFQSVHPEFNLAVASRGAVHARLSVPGQGTFETTESMVRIRPYSAVRDEVQQATGSRFFPLERTGRGRR